jgi:hypothetical protein
MPMRRDNPKRAGLGLVALLAVVGAKAASQITGHEEGHFNSKGTVLTGAGITPRTASPVSVAGGTVVHTSSLVEPQGKQHSQSVNPMDELFPFFLGIESK